MAKLDTNIVGYVDSVRFEYSARGGEYPRLVFKIIFPNNNSFTNPGTTIRGGYQSQEWFESASNLKGKTLFSSKPAQRVLKQMVEMVLKEKEKMKKGSSTYSNWQAFKLDFQNLFNKDVGKHIFRHPVGLTF